VTIASTFNVAARTKTTVNSVVHMERPLSPTTDLKAAPQMQQKYGTHLDTRVGQRAKKMLI
jgi:hypothetical protein